MVTLSYCKLVLYRDRSCLGIGIGLLNADMSPKGRCTRIWILIGCRVTSLIRLTECWPWWFLENFTDRGLPLLPHDRLNHLCLWVVSRVEDCSLALWPKIQRIKLLIAPLCNFWTLPAPKCSWPFFKLLISHGREGCFYCLFPVDIYLVLLQPICCDKQLLVVRDIGTLSLVLFNRFNLRFFKLSGISMVRNWALIRLFVTNALNDLHQFCIMISCRRNMIMIVAFCMRVKRCGLPLNVVSRLLLELKLRKIGNHLLSVL
jgi:hypothetical protein